MFFKFIVNLSVLETFLGSEEFKMVSGYMKFGIFDYSDIYSLVFYMLPEIMIIIFIMLNEIHLKLIGLYYQIEEEIEGINDGIQRNIEQGDYERVKQKKIQAANM